MTRGPTITPAELAQASEAFGREGTYSAAARAIGRDPAVTRRALVRAGEPARLVVYQRALDDGLDQARNALVAAVEIARAAVDAQVVRVSGATVYRTESLARMVDTLARATDTLGRLALQAERRRLLRAQRRALVAARSPSSPAAVVILPSEASE